MATLSSVLADAMDLTAEDRATLTRYLATIQRAGIELDSDSVRAGSDEEVVACGLVDPNAVRAGVEQISGRQNCLRSGRRVYVDDAALPIVTADKNTPAGVDGSVLGDLDKAT